MPQQRKVRIGDWTLDSHLNRIERKDQVVALEPRAAEVLGYLAQKARQVVSVGELTEQLWQRRFVGDSPVYRIVAELRRALEDDAQQPRYIETIRKRGYRLIARVEWPDEQTESIADTATVSSHTGAAQTTRWFQTKASQKVGVVLMVALTAAVFLAMKNDSARGSPSIAVLPFADMSTNQNNEHYADGITEMLIHQLSQIQGLKVIARTSSFAFKGKSPDIREVGELLGVSAILEGSVQRSNGRLRITAQLIDTRTGTHYWSEAYDRAMGDIFAIQDEIAAKVVEQLKISLLNPAPASRVVSAEAHRLYLLGRHHFSKPRPAEKDKAIRYFEQAIELDPEYAEAYANIAVSYLAIGFDGFMPLRDAMEKQRAATMRALEIDDKLATAHIAFAMLSFYYDRDWQIAEASYQRAISLNANDAEGHHFYTWFLAAMGRTQEAHNSIERALALDPLATWEYITASDVFYFSRQYDRAISRLQEALDLSPNDPFVLSRLGWSYLQKGMFDAAIGNMERAVVAAPDIAESYWMLGHAYAAAGKTAQARKILDDLHALAKSQYVHAYGFAMIHLGLGESDAALEWLEKAYEDRNPWMPFLQVEPRLDPLRADARFQDLLRRMNFPEQATDQ